MNTKLLINEILQIFTEDLKEIVNTFLDEGAKLSQENVEQICKVMNISIDELMIKLLRIASLYAKVPVSNFNVGAAALGNSGSIYLGANMEFEGEPLSTSLHAEQSAVTNAWQNGEDGILKLAVTSAPCGYCRQFLNELTTSSELKILLPDDSSSYKSLLLSQLLPEAFGPQDMNVNGGLMKIENNELNLSETAGDELASAAMKAASSSYAPYYNNYAGLSIKLNNGSIFSGRHAENAAHNPCLSPAHAAIGFMNMSSKLGDTKEIVDAVLVETKSVISQKSIAELILSSISNVKLRYYLIED